VDLTNDRAKAQKFQTGESADDDDEMEEETMLETALDRVDPYRYFKETLISMSWRGVQEILAYFFS
jgi:hypothetical protein